MKKEPMKAPTGISDWGSLNAFSEGELTPTAMPNCLLRMANLDNAASM
jgi:hypothetical protein